MEVVHNNQEEILMGSNEYLHLVKGKRTKRRRPLSPLTLPAMTTSTSSSGGGEQRGDNNFPSPTTPVEFSGISSEEEEDMANCLILLAQGGHKRLKQIDDHVDDENGKMARINSRRFYNDAAATTSKAAAGAGAGAGLYLYECKTCNKCFSSFQALGGHRAGHKRPNKGMCNEEKTSTITKTSSLLMLTELESPQHHQFNDNNNNNIASSTTISRPSLVLQMGNSPSTNVYSHNKSRVHECSICGSEFSSGQALGGHMRRHRTSNAAAATTRTNIDFPHHQDELNFSKKKARNGLSLDLNLPAPEEDYHHRESSKFSPQQPLVFSASALVDCHY